MIKLSKILYLSKHTAQGIYSILLFTTNTILCCTPLIPVALLKFIIPFKKSRNLCTKALHGLAYIWIFINVKGWIDRQGIQFQVNGLENIIHEKRYLVIANHQSWTDVTILQKLLYDKIPILTFFIKKQLIWVPLLGLAWWALDFPFMKRYSKDTLQKKPHLKGRDLRKAHETSQKLKTAPVSIMNFPEGTRFSLEKHNSQQSPFMHLLRPRAGGVAMIISSLKEQIDIILDITIIYPNSKKKFWDLLSGQIKTIHLTFEQIPVPKQLYGDYQNDKVFQKKFQKWLNQLWLDKDKKITTCIKKHNSH